MLLICPYRLAIGLNKIGRLPPDQLRRQITEIRNAVTQTILSRMETSEVSATESCLNSTIWFTFYICPSPSKTNPILFVSVKQRLYNKSLSVLQWCRLCRHFSKLNKSLRLIGQIMQGFSIKGNFEWAMSSTLLICCNWSSTLMFQNLCDRHHILKDDSWMCILHRYH